MRRYAFLAVIAAVLTGATLAFAQGAVQVNQYTSTAKVSPSDAGSTSTPSPTSATFGFTIKEANGLRPSAPRVFRISYFGVRENGALFPKCSLNAVVQNQSDSVCPSGSKVGSGELTANVGPTANPAHPGFPCKKAISLYNAGDRKFIIYMAGPASDCGGQASPLIIPGSYVRGKGGGEDLTFTVPDQVLHPIPGFTVAATAVTAKVNRRIVRRRGQRRGYLESVSCTRTRARPYKVDFTSEAGQKSSVRKSSVGRCR